jgi:hypothetical protein
MGQYKATSANSKNFILTQNNVQLGELIYPKWYTFNAEIILADKSVYKLVPQGFWESSIQLKKDDDTLLEFKLEWKGIVFSINKNGATHDYLLKLKGLLSSKFVLVDSDDNELFEVECDFKWTKAEYDYFVSTTEKFDQFENKELLLLSFFHAINYYLKVSSGL